VPTKPTKRDRREAARAARLEAQRRATKRRRKNFLYGGIGAAAVIGLIVAVIAASGGSDKIDVAALNKDAGAAGCTALTDVPDQGRQHIQSGATFPYNSNPPTSGSHYNVPGVAPAPTGVHLQPIPDEDQVHNLEHGHIGVQYSSALPDALVRALTDFTNQRDTYVFLAPRPTMPTGIELAFTRWDQKITCAAPTDATAVVKVAKAFYDDFHGLGPEGALPGTPITG
jgi:uncharacterized protein DUF3105